MKFYNPMAEQSKSFTVISTTTITSLYLLVDMRGKYKIPHYSYFDMRLVSYTFAYVNNLLII